MTPFNQLSPQIQIRRLRRLGRQALAAFGLEPAIIRLQAHWENTTFSLRSPDGARLLLRIHRPGYHSRQEIHSELLWLRELHRQGFVVPRPRSTPQGECSVVVETSDSGGPRICTLLYMIPGQFKPQAEPKHFGRIGTLLGRLHGLAQTWNPPEGFTRRQWDFKGTAGDQGGFGFGQQAWQSIPASSLPQLESACRQIQTTMERLGKHRSVYGLIHADLHLANVLFFRNQPHAIDFDDCGFGFYIYDLATTLCPYLARADWFVCRDALLNSYTKVATLPPQADSLLAPFMAARMLNILLWMIGRAQDHHGFRTQWPARLQQFIAFTQQRLGDS